MASELHIPIAICCAPCVISKAINLRVASTYCPKLQRHPSCCLLLQWLCGCVTVCSSVCYVCVTCVRCVSVCMATKRSKLIWKLNQRARFLPIRYAMSWPLFVALVVNWILLFCHSGVFLFSLVFSFVFSHFMTDITRNVCLTSAKPFSLGKWSDCMACLKSQLNFG